MLVSAKGTMACGPRGLDACQHPLAIPSETLPPPCKYCTGVGCCPQHPRNEPPAHLLSKAFQPFLLQLPLFVRPWVSGRVSPREADHLGGAFHCGCDNSMILCRGPRCPWGYWMWWQYTDRSHCRAVLHPAPGTKLIFTLPLTASAESGSNDSGPGWCLNLVPGSLEPAGIDVSLSQGHLSLTHHSPCCESVHSLQDSEGVS